MKFCIRIVFLWVALSASLLAQAQVFSNDFENCQEWNLPWLNLHIVADSTSTEENFVCICDSLHKYGLGFSIDKPFPNKNVSCKFGFRFKAEADTKAIFIISIDDSLRNRYWASYPLADFVDFDTEWSEAHLDLVFPSDYTQDSEIKGFVWNKGKETLLFDDARLEIKMDTHPSYQPEIEQKTNSIYLQSELLSTNLTPIVEYIEANGDTLSDISVVETRFEDGWHWHGNPDSIISKFARFKITFNKDVKLLRMAFIMPLPEGQLTVYRKNQHIDSSNFQKSYYLDREGFSIQNDSLRMSVYHPLGISSLQLNTDTRTACFNIDYWRDHPLIHYPMRVDTAGYFEDISYRTMRKGETLQGEINIFYNAMDDLPRLMPVWDGYQSAFIFTEHADWTDIRTHRAVLFGNEHITKSKDAVGGFCYYHIPITKSVFYWNPDNITNSKISEGRFPGLIESIKTDKDFFKLLKSIKKEGFEICLHSPEIYTTIPSEFPKAMRFMKKHFGTKSWIDHGYNNGPEKNREDMVCDGLLPDSPQYAVDLWKKNGVRYFWNPYYEENRMERYNFDNHFVQPYDGFGDALPNRQITTLPNGDKDFLLWSTSSTFEVNEDYEWYYYFDSVRLQRLVDQHNVFITHTYPAWSNPWRAFWQYHENSNVVAMPGFNFALSQLARFRDEKKILPTTIEAYLSYYEKLQNVEYIILNNKTIRLINHGEAIKGLTLLCTKPIVVEGKAADFRKVDEGYLFWFDMKKNESITIKHRE
jgi:hypothetical protein